MNSVQGSGRVTVRRRRSCGFAAVVVGLRTLAPVAADELPELNFNTWPNTDALMIAGPKCLGMQGFAQIGSVECAPDAHRKWLEALHQWRTQRRIYIGYDGARYDRPALRWTQSSFIQPQAMIEDRYLYDPVAGRYTVDRYLRDVEARYGGIDSILLWPVYPNLGIDDRNQLGAIRALPGGIAGVREMVAEFHRRGVRVLFPMNMWDQGTRDPGRAWPDALAALMAEIDADGVNGDTQDGVPLAFAEAAERIGHPLAFQPEGSPSDEAIAWNLLSWWEADPARYADFVPKVYRYKWLETRHMANVSDRWSRDRTDDLQAAFFNGVGWESWENVWGIWIGLTPRDAEAVRRMATLERGVARFLVSPEWEPFYPMLRFGVFASRWPLGDSTVWTIVNRNEYPVDGPELTVPWQEGERYYDLYRGIELEGRRDGDRTVLALPIEARGFGALLASRGPPDAGILALMQRMKSLTRQPLAGLSSLWRPLPQELLAVATTRRVAQAPPGMVEIPAGHFEFVVQGIELEGADAVGVDVAYPWEEGARRFHHHSMEMPRFFIDRHPVSNAEFKAFLAATHYHPIDDFNFLRDWRNGAYPDGWAHRPVTWVSLEDAQAYARWAGKRLPHEWEWQYAAQGSDGRRYPWGEAWRTDAVPVPTTGRALAAPDDSEAHPGGASPFGVLDLVGNVWQWTDQYQDEHTRAAIVRGGSYYRPQGALWYFPQAYRNDQHGKLLLMAPGRDRAGTIGFRCVVDANAP